MTAQQPITGGSDRDSTADDVLAGHDLGGQTAIVTGGYSGIGVENVRALSAHGATVIVPARRPDVARQALDGVDRVEVAELDLTDLESVSDFAEGGPRLRTPD